MALLDIQRVSKSYGPLQALSDVDLQVRPGTFHGLIGPNGSGKSTLLKLIAGAHFATAGRVEFDGTDITAATPYQRARLGLSLKFQITAVLPELSVYDNVLLALQTGAGMLALLRNRSLRRLREPAMAALEQFRLAGRADDLAGELSHGEQQWLEIAMALAPAPKLLLLDEPTGGMSPEERRLTGELLAPIKARCALVIVEHDLDFIRSICDRLTVLDQGRILGDGTVAEIEGNPRVQEIYTSRV